jgi:hypothetical protein
VFAQLTPHCLLSTELACWRASLLGVPGTFLDRSSSWLQRVGWIPIFCLSVNLLELRYSRVYTTKKPLYTIVIQYHCPSARQAIKEGFLPTYCWGRSSFFGRLLSRSRIYLLLFGQMPKRKEKKTRVVYYVFYFEAIQLNS